MTLGETLRYIFYERLLHPSLAYLAASAVASLPALGVVLFVVGREDSSDFGFFTLLSLGVFLTAYIAAFAALPACLAIWGLRLLKLPRGWGDAIAGAVLGGGLAQLIFHGASGLTQPPSLATLMFAACGLTGGLAYWVFRGRPRLPYGA